MFRTAPLEITQEEQDKFWSLVKIVLSNIFEEEEDQVDFYRFILDKGPEDEKLLILHDDHLNVAAQITGREVGPEEIDKYTNILNEFSGVKISNNYYYHGQ